MWELCECLAGGSDGFEESTFELVACFGVCIDGCDLADNDKELSNGLGARFDDKLKGDSSDASLAPDSSCAPEMGGGLGRMGGAVALGDVRLRRGGLTVWAFGGRGSVAGASSLGPEGAGVAVPFRWRDARLAMAGRGGGGFDGDGKTGGGAGVCMGGCARARMDGSVHGVFESTSSMLLRADGN